MSMSKYLDEPEYIALWSLGCSWRPLFGLPCEEAIHDYLYRKVFVDFAPGSSCSYLGGDDVTVKLSEEQGLMSYLWQTIPTPLISPQRRTYE